MGRSFRAGTGFVLTLLPALAAVGIAKAEPGDLNNDHEINLIDFGLFNDCITGPAGGTIPPECVAADFNSDTRVDLLDFGQFQHRFGFGQGPPRIISIAPSPGQWTVDDHGLAEVHIGFDEPVTIPPNSVTAWTVGGGTVAGLSTSYDSATDVLTVSFSPAIRDDRLTLVVDYTVVDLAGDELDGEILNPSDSRFPSGNGIRGGQSVFRFSVLQGEVNRDGVVDATDGSMIDGSLGLCGPLPGTISPTNPADLNSDGCVNVLDVNIFQAAVGNSLPVTDGGAPQVVDVLLGPATSDLGALTAVTVEFDEAILAERLVPRSCFLIDAAQNLLVPSSVIVSADGLSANFAFAAPFQCDGTYSFNVSNAIADVSGELFSRPAVPPQRSGLTPPPAPTITVSATMTNEAAVSLNAVAPDAVSLETSNPAGIVEIPVSAGVASGDVALAFNRVNQTFFTSISACGVRSAPTAIAITQDSQPPSVFVDFPSAGSEITTETTDVAGRVSDMLSGFMGLTVTLTVNGMPFKGAVVVDEGIGTNGTFFAGGVPLNVGVNTVVATATDELSNVRESIPIAVEKVDVPPDSPEMIVVSGNGQEGVAGSVLSEPITILVTKGDKSNTPFADKVVTFDVTRSNGRLAATAAELIPTPDNPDPGSMMFQDRTDAQGLVHAFWRLGTDAGCGNNRVEASSNSIAGTTALCATATPRQDNLQINIGSGNNQLAEVNAPACQPLRVWVNDGCNGVANVPVTFLAVRGGGQVNGDVSITVMTSDTGHAEVNFTLGPEGGNNIVTADFDNNLAALAEFVVFGVQREVGAPTGFSALIIDNANRPIQGATCTLAIGSSDPLVAVSDDQGQCRYDDLDTTGSAQLFVNGLTATHVNGQPVQPGSFPSLHFEPIIVPNLENTLLAPVRLPPLNPENAVVYDGTSAVELAVDGVAGLRMIVASGTTVTLPDGTIVGPDNPGSVILTLNQVHHDDIPMPMPDGAAPPFAWTLQPGGTTFEPPLQVIYPNMSGLPPGSLAFFLSFNANTNRFDIVATGQVSDDGLSIASDPGAGIALAGWGCNCPPYSVTGECCSGDASNTSGLPAGPAGGCNECCPNNAPCCGSRCCSSTQRRCVAFDGTCVCCASNQCCTTDGTCANVGDRCGNAFPDRCKLCTGLGSGAPPSCEIHTPDFSNFGRCGLHGKVCGSAPACSGGLDQPATSSGSWQQCCEEPVTGCFYLMKYEDFCSATPPPWDDILACPDGPTPFGCKWCGQGAGSYICTRITVGNGPFTEGTCGGGVLIDCAVFNVPGHPDCDKARPLLETGIDAPRSLLLLTTGPEGFALDVTSTDPASLTRIVVRASKLACATSGDRVLVIASDASGSSSVGDFLVFDREAVTPLLVRKLEDAGIVTTSSSRDDIEDAILSIDGNSAYFFQCGVREDVRSRKICSITRFSVDAGESSTYEVPMSFRNPAFVNIPGGIGIYDTMTGALMYFREDGNAPGPAALVQPVVSTTPSGTRLRHEHRFLYVWVPDVGLVQFGQRGTGRLVLDGDLASTDCPEWLLEGRLLHAEWTRMDGIPALAVAVDEVGDGSISRILLLHAMTGEVMKAVRIPFRTHDFTFTRDGTAIYMFNRGSRELVEYEVDGDIFRAIADIPADRNLVKILIP